jgi:hypothetical protein
MKKLGVFVLVTALSFSIIAGFSFAGSLLGNIWGFMQHLALWYISLFAPVRDSFSSASTSLALPTGPPDSAAPEGLRTLAQVLQSVPGRRAFEKHV